MSAMRLVSVAELEEALVKSGCIKTDRTSETSTYWYTANKVLFSVPEPDALSGSYSDFIYYDLLQFVKSN